MMMQSTTHWQPNNYEASSRRRFIDAILLLFPEVLSIGGLIIEVLLFWRQHQVVIGELLMVIRTNTDLLIGAAMAFIELMRLVNGILNLCMWCYVAAEWCYVGFDRLMMPQYGRV